MTADTATHRLIRQRDVALSVLAEVSAAVAAGQPADATLARVFNQHPMLGSRDRRRCAHVLFAQFRWLGWTTHLAPSSLLHQVAWSLALEPDPASAAPDPAVTAWRAETGLTEAESIALARADLATKAALLRQHAPETHLAPADLLPAWTADALDPGLDLATFITAVQSRPPTWVWIEPYRRAAFAAMLTAQRLDHHLHPLLPGAVAIATPFQRQLLERAWGGPIQIQDIGSQAVAAICAARPGESWWDACSGAGGKTLHLARQVGTSGSVIATDIRPTVLANLQRRAAENRLTQITALPLDSANDVPPGRIFDGVLVDAPCSGLGTWPRNPDARWRTGPDDLARHAETQRRLLHHVAPRVKAGGRLVYALCTLTRLEAHAVTAWFLERHPEFAPDPFIDPLRGVTIDGERFIHPGEGPGDGMFVAAFRRDPT
ncbi:MAG TPA: RsmB/NOP family class I SAM-dependent RNA methyltransferase [Kiritimatiellia bacterium]|nr:RsmB/NOP family class I SAM-dependent RNA methyltransferase [Kiritimatiellia bacterium]HMP35566.1 RsmB/NOP family class I SAM-dependent RNA methyltransferase [Kiritimatiellia bacterium]